MIFPLNHFKNNMFMNDYQLILIFIENKTI